MIKYISNIYNLTFKLHNRFQQSQLFDYMWITLYREHFETTSLTHNT